MKKNILLKCNSKISFCYFYLKKYCSLQLLKRIGLNKLDINKLVDKPGSVADNHLSGIYVTIYLKRPTRTSHGPCVLKLMRIGSYLVLLQVGFSLPQLLPVARCALTAPFHPYLKKAVYFLWHFP